MLGEGERGRGGGRGDMLQEGVQQPETVCATRQHIAKYIAMETVMEYILSIYWLLLDL